MPNYFLDGTTLANSTAVYSDAAMSICAPSGYYSDGIIVRQQVIEGGTCKLLAAEICESCAEPCGGSINTSGGQGIYKMTLNVGGTPSDVGAMIIQMNPYSIPDGVFVQYDGTVYNKGVRADGNTDTLILGNGFNNAGGLAQSRNANNYTVVGTDTTSCGVYGNLIGSGNLDVYNFVNGSFVATGNQEAYTISLDDCVLQYPPYGPPAIQNFVIVVPKTSASPEDVLVQFIGPCGGTAFQVAVSCPTSLPGFASNVVPASGSVAACTNEELGTLYAVGTGALFGDAAPTTTPQIRDQVFTDPNGANFVQDGWYSYDNSGVKFVFKTEDGIVVDLLNCTA
jgi:hypothetical protein